MLNVILAVIFPVLLIASSLNVQDKQIDMKKIIVDECTRNAFREFYQYDRTLPLDARVLASKPENGFVMEKICFKSVHDQTVPALLALPKHGDKPYPCVLILHSASGKKENMRRWMEVMIGAGYAAMALDAQYHGERTHVGGYLDPKTLTDKQQWYRVRDFLIQTAIDYRRAIDYLETRKEIDSKRIASLGESMGGIINVPLSAVEERIRVCVLVLSGGAVARYTGKDMIRALAPVCPMNFVSQIAPRAFLMQNGRLDKVILPEHARALYDAAGNPKQIDWHDIGHGPEAGDYIGLTQEKILEWLQMHL
ncbi:alpha/beta hydrolase [candidate division KSB1 bacterium]|nr:alpha/beta hydrolase [candidate division KSB1 bacterium]